MKNKLGHLCMLIMLAGVIVGCDDTVTYADRLDAEQAAISEFIKTENINVISEATFEAQDSTTDVSKNEYVFLSDSGVYLQIVQNADGKSVETNDEILVRFKQINISVRDTLTNFNTSISVDEMRYVKSSSTSSGQFINSYGGMYQTYGSAVPAGWLIPLEYITIGRSSSDRAHIKIIVPSKMGHSTASGSVLPYYYELFFQLSR
ncbi:MAG: DUF4827 domain-containing protein [Bacteroidaceae bacterium]|nr:DUF4827 domain-containing protein [Bacteroidaceae bacterium]